MALYDTGLWIWDDIPPHEPVEFGVRFLWKWVGVAMPGPMNAGQPWCDFGPWCGLAHHLVPVGSEMALRNRGLWVQGGLTC